VPEEEIVWQEVISVEWTNEGTKNTKNNESKNVILVQKDSLINTNIFKDDIKILIT